MTFRRLPTGRAACLAGFIVAGAIVGGLRSTAAIDAPLTEEQMARALTLARWPTSDADRVQFHARYVVPVHGPIVHYYSIDSVEVVTEFRRLELIAEDHARVNDMFGRSGLQEVEAALAPWHDRVAIDVHLTFALNGFITGIPALEIWLDGANGIVPVASAHATAVYGQNSMLVGGVVEVLFDARQIGSVPRTVVVGAPGGDAEPVKVAIDFRSLE